MRPFATLLILGLLGLLVRADTANPAGEKPTPLAPYAVKDDPVNSYAFDVKVLADKATHRITHLLIVRVPEGTDAARAGLEAGDEIVAVNGMKVTEMEPRVDPDSPLGRAMVNRDPDTKLELEVIERRQRHVTLRALRAAPGGP